MIRNLRFVTVLFLLGVGDLVLAQVRTETPTQPSEARKNLTDLDGADAVVYKSIDQTDLKMYVFRPTDLQSDELRPAIVFFFGGGWSTGTPAQFTQQCRYFASRGMVAMTADYRVSSRHGTKAVHCVADAKSAIRWVRKNADELGVDPARIVAAGGSAGGHLAACTGVVEGMDEQWEDLRISSKPNALILFNPVLALTPIDKERPLADRAEGLRDRIGDDPAKISPFDHVRAGQPPTIIFFGTDDRLLQGATHFERATRDVGNRCELLTWEGLPHGFFNYGRFDNKPYAETVRAADEFLESLGYLGGNPTIEVPQ